MTRMTYGTLPTREEFDTAFERECPKGYHVELGPSDAEACDGFNFGDGVWSADDLWDFIVRVMSYWECGPVGEALDVMDVVSGVMLTLGFEWV